MVDPLGELMLGIGDAIAKDSDFLKSEQKTKSRIIHALYYIVPISILVGFYVWTVY